MRVSFDLRKSLAVQWVFVISILTCVGCGEDSGRETITGRVTYQGQALSNATVTFFPQQGRPTIAPLDAESAYSVNLLPGTYQVTVLVGTEVPADYEEGDPLPPPAVRLPEHYTVRARTTLSAEVAEDQSEPINFDLK